MHSTIRRSVAALSLTALLSASAPLLAGDSDAPETAVDKDFAQAAAQIERAKALEHRPAEHGLVAMHARFRFTTTAFVNAEAGKAVVGQLFWSKETGLLVKIDEDSAIKVGAEGPLMTVESVMTGIEDRFTVTPRDRVLSCTESAIEVVAHAPSDVRRTAESCGWEGAPTVRITFDEHGRVRAVRAEGSPSEQALAAGAPNCIDTTFELADAPKGKSAVITRLRMDLLTGPEGERRHVQSPMQWLDNHIEYVELGDARVPSHLVMDIGSGESEVLRRDEIELTEITALEAVPAAGLEGFNPVGEREVPPEPLAAGSLAPEWSLMSSEGERISSKDSKGKAVVVMFWATWCGPCKLAAPVIQELLEEHGAENLAAYAITCSETRVFGEKTGHDAGEMLRSNGGKFPALVAGDDVASAYGVPAYPTIFVLDQTGQIVWRQTGYGDSTRDEFRAVVATAVASAAAADSAAATDTADAR